MSADTRLGIRLGGTALRIVDIGMSGDEAIALLRDLAAGRGDLLAETGAGMLGGYISSPGTHNPRYVLAAAYLIVAGADPNFIVDAFETARKNASVPRPNYQPARPSGTESGERSR